MQAQYCRTNERVHSKPHLINATVCTAQTALRKNRSRVNSDPESGHLQHIPYEKVRLFSLSNETLSLQITHVRFHVARDSLLGNETLVI